MRRLRVQHHTQRHQRSTGSTRVAVLKVCTVVADRAQGDVRCAWHGWLGVVRCIAKSAADTTTVGSAVNTPMDTGTMLCTRKLWHMPSSMPRCKRAHGTAPNPEAMHGHAGWRRYTPGESGGSSADFLKRTHVQTWVEGREQGAGNRGWGDIWFGVGGVHVRACVVCA